MTGLDDLDSQLLTEVQKDAMLTAQELGDRLNLSPSQAGRRRQRLEADGYITGYSAKLNPDRLGLSVQAFVQVQMTSHAPEMARSFASLITKQAEVISAWAMTGEADYLLRVWCADLAGLHHLTHKVLLAHAAVGRIQSQIVMDQFKQDAALPT